MDQTKYRKFVSCYIPIIGIKNFTGGAAYTVIGDLPIGARVAAATPDKGRNMSTRNQKVMNKEHFGKRIG